MFLVFVAISLWQNGCILHYSYCYGYLMNTCQHIGESVYYLTSKELQQKVLWSFLVLFDVEKNGI